MAGLFSYVSSLLGGGNGGEEGADGGAHGHSHNGQPCHGHGAPPPQMMMGGGGGHGHSHGGQPCHGHGAPPPQMMMGGGGGHGHSHGGQPCHGHGGGGSSQQPLPQIKEFAFSRDQLLTFFNRFIAELEKPETKQRLRDAVAAKEQVEEATEKVQRELLADMKIDVENGLASLQHVQRMYATDREVMQTFLQFVTCESMACDEAEMTPEEFQKKVENVQNEMKQRQIMAVQQRAAMMGLAEDKQAELVAMLKEEQEKLGPRAPLVEQQNMMMRVQAKLQSMLVLTPDQEERLRRVAAERMEARQRANPGLTDQQVMQQAMQKLQLASQMMKQSGLSEEQVAQELMKRLREGNFEVSSAHSHGGVPCSHSHGAPGEPAGHDDADDVPEELTAQTKVERT